MTMGLPTDSDGNDLRFSAQMMGTKKWRAEYLRLSAKRLDIQIERLKKQAAEYRELADSLSR